MRNEYTGEEKLYRYIGDPHRLSKCHQQGTCEADVEGSCSGRVDGECPFAYLHNIPLEDFEHLFVVEE